MGGPEKRRYKRLKADWVVDLRPVGLTDSAIIQLRRIHNLSLGGVYIETSMTSKPGTLMEFDFAMPGRRERVHARGVVRWVNNEATNEMPAGIGIEFLEVSSDSREAINEFVRSESAREHMSVLTRSKLHQSLLRFYCRKVGSSFPVDVLAQYLSCGQAELMQCLKDFSLYKLVRFERDSVTFTAAESAEVAQAVQNWYQMIDHGQTPAGGTPAV